jgi:hypothetical protein
MYYTLQPNFIGREFLKNLGTERTDLLNVMISKELPKIKIKE